MSEWISVDKRLPEKWQNVLVTRAGGAPYIEFILSSGGWERDDIAKTPVTHWMPLPQPPEEAERNKQLTVDEIRSFKGGKPVVLYVVCLDDEGKPDFEFGEWEMCDGVCFVADGTWDLISNYGVNFVAYRNKPKEAGG